MSPREWLGHRADSLRQLTDIRPTPRLRQYRGSAETRPVALTAGWPEARRATTRLAAIPAFELRLDRPQITPEAIRWEGTPAAPAAAVRSAVREAIGEVWQQVPEPADGFAPHVTIAYSNATGPTAPVAAALDSVDAAPAPAQIRSAELIVLGRDRRMYEWETYATVPLSPGR
ncbi:2'-5' RNA ligase family protein [Streptosporangium sandarakinum]|uniref:2'-5' RNA ligase family protein n=1 Tax=Streptosporangium sandarakinum TaxID=1260955 RepID=UPI0036B81627